MQRLRNVWVEQQPGFTGYSFSLGVSLQQFVNFHAALLSHPEPLVQTWDYAYPSLGMGDTGYQCYPP